MKVVFAIKYPSMQTSGVYWEADGETHERSLLSDNTMRDRVVGDSVDRNLYWVTQRLGSEYVSMRPTEVKSIAAAMKYLGKSSDLIQLLPEADFDDSEKTPGEAF